jgi:hypothetical protein
MLQLFRKKAVFEDGGLRDASVMEISSFWKHVTQACAASRCEPPAALQKQIDKAGRKKKQIACLKLRRANITDGQARAIAAALEAVPIVAELDLRENRISDEGAAALMGVMQQQLLAAKNSKVGIYQSDRGPAQRVMGRGEGPVLLKDSSRYITKVSLDGNKIDAGALERIHRLSCCLEHEDSISRVRLVFDFVDIDHSGTIEKDELKKAMKVLTGTEPSNSAVGKMLKECDINGDGIVDTQEIMQSVSQNLSDCDRSILANWQGLVVPAAFQVHDCSQDQDDDIEQAVNVDDCCDEVRTESKLEVPSQHEHVVSNDKRNEPRNGVGQNNLDAGQDSHPQLQKQKQLDEAQQRGVEHQGAPHAEQQHGIAEHSAHHNYDEDTAAMLRVQEGCSTQRFSTDLTGQGPSTHASNGVDRHLSEDKTFNGGGVDDTTSHQSTHFIQGTAQHTQQQQPPPQQQQQQQPPPLPQQHQQQSPPQPQSQPQPQQPQQPQPQQPQPQPQPPQPQPPQPQQQPQPQPQPQQQPQQHQQPPQQQQQPPQPQQQQPQPQQQQQHHQQPRVQRLPAAVQSPSPPQPQSMQLQNAGGFSKAMTGAGEQGRGGSSAMVNVGGLVTTSGAGGSEARLTKKDPLEIPPFKHDRNQHPVYQDRAHTHLASGVISDNQRQNIREPQPETQPENSVGSGNFAQEQLNSGATKSKQTTKLEVYTTTDKGGAADHTQARHDDEDHEAIWRQWEPEYPNFSSTTSEPGEY